MTSITDVLNPSGFFYRYDRFFIICLIHVQFLNINSKVFSGSLWEYNNNCTLIEHCKYLLYTRT